MILDSIGMDELIVYADEAGFDLRDWLSAILSGSAFPNTALSDLFDKIKEIIIADGVRILALSFAASGILSMLRMTVQNLYYLRTLHFVHPGTFSSNRSDRIIDRLHECNLTGHDCSLSNGRYRSICRYSQFADGNLFIHC